MIDNIARGMAATALKNSGEGTVDKAYVDNAIAEVEAIAKGRATGYVFDTVEDMNTWLANETNVAQLVLGDNLYIRAINVPDYWWDGSSAQQLETQKVDLSEYVKTAELKNEETARISSDESLSQDIIEITNSFQNFQFYPIVTEISDNTLVLEYRQEARLGECSSLVLKMPSNITAWYESYFSFKSGTTPTTLTYSSTSIIWNGDDCNEDGIFTPQANTNYEISIKRVGTDSDNNPIIIARVGSWL